MGFDFDGFSEEHAAPAPAATAMLTLAETDAVAVGPSRASSPCDAIGYECAFPALMSGWQPKADRQSRRV